MKICKVPVKDERLLIAALKDKEMEAFMTLYQEYGDDLVQFAFARLKDPDLAAIATEDLFEELWNKAHSMEIKVPFHLFLKNKMAAICRNRMAS